MTTFVREDLTEKSDGDRTIEADIESFRKSHENIGCCCWYENGTHTLLVSNVFFEGIKEEKKGKTPEDFIQNAFISSVAKVSPAKFFRLGVGLSCMFQTGKWLKKLHESSRKSYSTPRFSEKSKEERVATSESDGARETSHFFRLLSHYTPPHRENSQTFLISS